MLIDYCNKIKVPNYKNKQINKYIYLNINVNNFNSFKKWSNNI